MKRKPMILKVGAVALALILISGYVVARSAGWIGARAGETPPSPTVTAPRAEEKPAEYFSGSKSGSVVTPKQTKEFMPGSKIMVLDPLPPKTDQPHDPAKPPAAPKQPAQPAPAPK